MVTFEIYKTSAASYKQANLLRRLYVDEVNLVGGHAESRRLVALQIVDERRIKVVLGELHTKTRVTRIGCCLCTIIPSIGLARV